MPTLEWIGKKAVLTHHAEIPYRLLRCNEGLSVGEAGSGNLLVQGDNLEALKALLPYYGGQVKCIYIDPPYNTGNENWVYNDNVNSPEIRNWLGKVVGNEAEDLSRHDKWLCMMYPRLQLLYRFLRDDGVMFVSIDDNEVNHLRCVCDVVFGRQNLVASIIWQKRTSPDARLNLGPAHDYIVCYARNIGELKPTLHKVPLSQNRTREYKNPDSDPRGPWASVDMTGQTGHATPEQFYEIETPSGRRIKPPAGRCWALAETTLKRLAADNRVWFGSARDSRPRLKKFLNEAEGTMAWTWWSNEEVGHNQEATKELADILGVAGRFETPKPLRLLIRILQIATDRDSLILDSFAGSGTTGHAVLALNKADGGNRRFILVEMEKDICQKITAQRLRRAIEGYTVDKGGGKKEEVPGLGGGFRYCELGPTLFDAQGQIRSEVNFEELAAHVFFTEAGEPLTAALARKGRGGPPSPLIGIHHGTAVYLLYNGVLKDKSADGGNVLTLAVLDRLPRHDGPKIIYGTGCRLGPSRLRRQGITFRQIPYQVKVS